MSPSQKCVRPTEVGLTALSPLPLFRGPTEQYGETIATKWGGTPPCNLVFAALTENCSGKFMLATGLFCRSVQQRHDLLQAPAVVRYLGRHRRRPLKRLDNAAILSEVLTCEPRFREIDIQ